MAGRTDMEYAFGILPYILSGAEVSLTVYVITFIFSIPVGIICAVAKLSKIAPLRWIMNFYTWIMRGTPLMLQLFFVYYGLPLIPGGVKFTPMEAAGLTFVINYAAYFTEIFRGGICSIEQGQYEAAKALGMSYAQTMRRIILPQAIKNVLPPMGNEAINLIKDTALCYVISMADIMKNAKVCVSRDFSITGFVLAAFLYLAITFIIINIFRMIERRYMYYR